MRKTYQLVRGRRLRILGEAAEAITKMQTRDHAARAVEIVRRRDEAITRVRDAYGVRWDRQALLEVGCGQRCTWSLAFGVSNTVTAVDLDVVPQRFSLATYGSMLRSNGPYRVAKTLGRKMLGIDRRQTAALAKAVRGPLVWPSTHRMDAEDLQFPDNSFDGVFSFAVFEHIADPQKAMREVCRVLKKGGAAYIVLELFTSIAGAHDPRLWNSRQAMPSWAHLRPNHAASVIPNVYINRVRLAEYQQMAGAEFADVCLYKEERGTAKYLNELSTQERDELSEYTDEELVTQDLVILGRKRA